MMRGFRNILWLLPFFLVLLWPLWQGPAARWLVPREYVPEVVSGMEEQRPAAVKSFSMDTILFSQHRSGVRDWQIRLAGLRSADDNEDLMYLEGVEAQFFAEERRKFLITGHEGRYHGDSRLLILQEDVRVHSEDDGLLVLAETMSYDDVSRRISTDMPVRITGENFDVHGMGLLYDMEGGDYEVAGRVRVETR